MWKLDTVEVSQCKYNYVLCKVVCKESASKYKFLCFEFVDCLNANKKIVFNIWCSMLLNLDCHCNCNFYQYVWLF